MKAYAYHVWVEVFTGEWYGMDPTFGFDFLTPAHFGFVKTDLNDMTFGEDGMIKLISLIRDFDIAVN